jgi:hypothetical protein
MRHATPRFAEGTARGRTRKPQGPVERSFRAWAGRVGVVISVPSAIVALAVPAQAAHPAVVLADCGGYTGGVTVAPREWDDGCTEVSDLVRASWRHWGTREAEADGYHELDDCEPDCGRGTVSSYPARATAYRIRTCAYGGRRYSAYTRVRIRYSLPLANPFGLAGGSHIETFRLKCG